MFAQGSFKMIKFFFFLVVIIPMYGCVSPMALKDQLPIVDYTSKAKVIVAVLDKRKRVTQGKPKDFIGVAHATFGIPVDWDVKTVIATEKEDADRNLSDWLKYRIVEGLNQKGWDSIPVSFVGYPDIKEIDNKLTLYQADMIYLFVLKEWYFSINLNWVSAFNFDTDTELYVYNKFNSKEFFKNFKERDVINESSSESAQNNVLRAYKDQIQQILNDDELKAYVSNSLLRNQSDDKQLTRKIIPIKVMLKKLTAIQALFDDGLMTEKEYELEKAKLLSKI